MNEQATSFGFDRASGCCSSARRSPGAAVDAARGRRVGAVPAWSAGWLTCRRRLATTCGVLLVGDVDDPRRRRRRRRCRCRASPALYSSNSSTYGWPFSVNGIAFCGIDARSHVSRLISRACGFGLARLDLAGVEDQHVAAGRVGDVGAVAVVAERHAVRDDVALPDRVRRLRVGHVDRGDRRCRGAASRRTSCRRSRSRSRGRGARAGRANCSTGWRQSLRARRRSRRARVGRRVAADGGEQAAPAVEVQRLVRREHRRLGQRGGLHRLAPGRSCRARRRRAPLVLRLNALSGNSSAVS